MMQRRETICLLGSLLGLALLAQAGCSDDRRRLGGGGGGGADPDAGAVEQDASGCQLAAVPEGRQEGSLVKERVAFEDADGNRVALRDLCGQVIWVQVGSEDT